MDIITLSSYTIMEALMILSPGPAVLTVIQQSVKNSKQHGIQSTLGIVLGSIFHFTLAALGIWSITVSYPNLIYYINGIGACILIFIGLHILCSKSSTTHTLTKEDSAPTTPTWKSFLLGITIQITNPKLICFLILVLPQFLILEANYTIQITILGFITIVLETIILIGYCYISCKGIQFLNPSHQLPIWIDRVSGVFLIGFGSFLLFSLIVSITV